MRFFTADLGSLCPSTSPPPPRLTFDKQDPLAMFTVTGNEFEGDGMRSTKPFMEGALVHSHFAFGTCTLLLALALCFCPHSHFGFAV